MKVLHGSRGVEKFVNFTDAASGLLKVSRMFIFKSTGARKVDGRFAEKALINKGHAGAGAFCSARFSEVLAGAGWR